MRIVTCLFTLGYSCLCVLNGLLGDEKERVVDALRTDEAIVINGGLEEKVWQEGEWSTGFFLVGEAREKASVQTFFKVAYDDNYLYVAMKMDEPDMRSIRLFEYERDGPVHQDDSVELMLDPYGDHTNYYRFTLNAAGIQLDEERNLSGLLHEYQWNVDWLVATRLEENVWTVEMAIPFSQLRLDHRSLKEWRFNIARNRYAGGAEEFSSYAPVKENFNEPENFAVLRFSEGQFKKHLWKLVGPYDYLVETNNDGRWMLKGKARLWNLGSGFCESRLAFSERNQQSFSIVDSLNANVCEGESQEFQFSFPIDRKYPTELIAEVTDTKDLSKVFLKEVWSLNLNYDIMTVSLVEPSYRQAIYSTQNLSEIKLKVSFNLVEDVLKKSELRIQLISKSDGKVEDKVLIKKVVPSDVYSLSIKDLEFGSYQIRAQLLNRKQEVLYEQEVSFTKLLPVPYEWWIDREGDLRLNGKAVMPTGLFRMTADEFEKRKEPYMAIFQDQDKTMSLVEAEKYLNEAHNVGAKCVLYPYPDNSFITALSGFEQLLTKEEEIEIRKYVQALQRNPALMAWVLAFLPTDEFLSEKRLEQIYKIVSEQDPFHPCIVIVPGNHPIAHYSNAADILMPFMSMAFLEKGDASRPLRLVSQQAEIAESHAKLYEDEVLAFWMCLQAYNQTLSGDTLTRFPNFDESRNMLYQGVVMGAKGFFWYHFKQFRASPIIEKIVQFLAQELKLLQDAIMAPDLPIEERIVKASDPMIASLLKKVNGEYCLFAVNLVNEKKEVAFKVPQLKDKKVLYVVSEGREVKLADEGSFKDVFAPYGVHIYSTRQLMGPKLPEKF